MLSRRKFLGASFSVCALPSLSVTGDINKSIKRYKLVADQSHHTFSDDLPSTNLWLYNNHCPGPLITANKGDVLEVFFTNKLDQPTSIHWHGIRNLNKMDGVPGLTQKAVEPGESFTYRFPLNDSGSFWYHAHNRAWEQVSRGLYGALLVLEEQNWMNVRDRVLLIDDWRIDQDGLFDQASLGNLHDWSHRGRLGNFLTVNGKSGPKIDLPFNGSVRLRFINSANARVMVFKLNDGLPAKIISLDGSPCKPFFTDRLTLAPGQRMDAMITDCSQLDNLWEISTRQEFIAARFSPVMTVPVDRGKKYSSDFWYPLPSRINAKIIDIDMRGGAMGNLNYAVFQGEKRDLRDLAINEKKIWALNGKIGSYGLNLGTISLGEVAILRVLNDTAWDHVMHLHGQHFWVKSKEFGDDAKYVLRDTYLMKPKEKADLIFSADNPGLWLFHCHTLEHHAAGMAGVISVI